MMRISNLALRNSRLLQDGLRTIFAQDGSRLSEDVGRDGLGEFK
jgi:hypothetical protein